MAVHTPWVEQLLETYLAGKTIKAMLVTSDYEDDAAVEYRSDITDEVSGTGYTAGGIVVTGVGVVESDGSLNLTCDSVVFGGVLLEDVGGIVFYVSTGDPATDTILSADVFNDDELDTLEASSFSYVTPAGFISFVGLA